MKPTIKITPFFKCTKDLLDSSATALPFVTVKYGNYRSQSLRLWSLDDVEMVSKMLQDFILFERTKLECN